MVKSLGRGGKTALLVTPAVVALGLGSVVPLFMTLWFSILHYNLINPDFTGFAGLENYRFLIGDPAFWTSLRNTLTLVGAVLSVTISLVRCWRCCSISISLDAGSPACL